MQYDFLIVGAGLFGGVCARELVDAGYKVLVLEKRAHIAGNIFTADADGIAVHQYGAHIFHTSLKDVWDYVNRFAGFNNFINSPLANYRGEIYNLPFNMNTFHQLWGVVTPTEAAAKIASQRQSFGGAPQNLEEQAISLAGRDIYEKLIKGYTEKQWGRSCRELPAFIIRRVPLRYTYDNNYFNDRYQGIPLDGYTALAAKLLAGSEVRLGVDYAARRDEFAAAARHVIYTGPIDEYFRYRFGPLAWRSLRFETERLDCENYQGVAVMNFTDRETPYTRVIEHKHFAWRDVPHTIITREYPAAWQPGDEPFYPVNDAANTALYEKYQSLAAAEPNISFGGRLGTYQYYDMDKTVAAALALVEKLRQN